VIGWSNPREKKKKQIWCQSVPIDERSAIKD
jgi:hypothetical protein